MIVAAGLVGAQGMALAQDNGGLDVGGGTSTDTTPTPTPEPAPVADAGGYAGLHSGLEGIEIPLFSSDFSALVNAVNTAAGGAAATPTVPTANFIWGLNATAAIDAQLGIVLDHDPGAAAVPPAPATPSSTRFGAAIGAGYRMYKTMKGKLRPYMEPGVRLAIPDFGNAGTTIALGAFGELGVEVLLTQQVTVGTQIGASLDFSQKFKKDVLATETGVVDVGFWW